MPHWIPPAIRFVRSLMSAIDEPFGDERIEYGVDLWDRQFIEAGCQEPWVKSHLSQNLLTQATPFECLSIPLTQGHAERRH